MGPLFKDYQEYSRTTCGTATGTVDKYAPEVPWSQAIVAIRALAPTLDDRDLKRALSVLIAELNHREEFPTAGKKCSLAQCPVRVFPESAPRYCPDHNDLNP